MKKRPIDIIIIGCIFIIIGTINFYDSLTFDKENLINEYRSFNVASNVPLDIMIFGNYFLMIFAIGFFIGGIGILRCKKWGQKLLVITYIINLIEMFIALVFSSLIVTGHLFKLIPTKTVIMLCFALLIYALPFLYINTKRFKSFLV